EYLCLLLHHYHVVGHPGQISAAGGRISEHDRDAGDAHLRASGDLAETAATRNEDLCLDGRMGAGRFDEAYAGEVVFGADIGEPSILELADLADCAAFD